MNEIIVLSAISEFTWLVIDGFMEVLSSLQYRTSLRNGYKIWNFFLASQYHENDTKTDYQEVVYAGDQKWEMIETTIGIIFFSVWDAYYYFSYIKGILKSSLKKFTPPKMPIPTQNPDLT